ncbi:hypothetical protein NSQ76_20565 [Bacillus sp. FSL M8-0256]|uniref:hypothetical protein n=1 Tax=Bacillus sp. FSL M8-0256 TaxID=2954578 RepID=UPI0030FA36A7
MSDEKVKMFICRTTKMSDEMYNHVTKRIQDFDSGQHKGTFREYAFYLIQKEMDEIKKGKTEKEKDPHVLDVLLELKNTVNKEFRRIGQKIDQKTIIGDTTSPAKKSTNLTEGIILDDVVTGEIDEPIDNDY